MRTIGIDHTKCHLDLDSLDLIDPKNVGIHQVRACQLSSERDTRPRVMPYPLRVRRCGTMVFGELSRHLNPSMPYRGAVCARCSLRDDMEEAFLREGSPAGFAQLIRSYGLLDGGFRG